MAAKTKSKVTPKYKTKYRVKNWPTYEAALRNRGDITLWFDEEYSPDEGPIWLFRELTSCLLCAIVGVGAGRQQTK
jgi:hypothetical protein